MIRELFAVLLTVLVVYSQDKPKCQSGSFWDSDLKTCLVPIQGRGFFFKNFV